MNLLNDYPMYPLGDHPNLSTRYSSKIRNKAAMLILATSIHHSTGLSQSNYTRRIHKRYLNLKGRGKIAPDSMILHRENSKDSIKKLFE